MKQLEEFDIALRLAGFNFNKQTVELIISIYNLVNYNGEETTLKDVCKIIESVEHKYTKKNEKSSR